jgi:hypothetical protein
MMTTPYIRHCPQCGSDRPASEVHCENLWNGGQCQWPLSDEEIRVAGEAAPRAAETPPVETARRCATGHEIDAGDLLCLTCGAEAVETAKTAEAAPPAPPPAEQFVLDGWQVTERVPTKDEPWERFVVEEAATGRRALMTLYRLSFEPDPAVHDLLRRMPRDHIPELIATGRHEGRAYEVVERIEAGTLAEAGCLAANAQEVLRRLVDELGRALADFAEVGLRHRDIRPSTILLRTREPLDLVITGFGSARLSDFDLEAVAPLELTRYSAPEAIVGGVSAASDWWSLGMIVLEQATSGACFTGVNDKAFQIHVVTRGVELPATLEPSIRLLLRGLLERDPLKRWSWPQVRAWLAGEPVEVPPEGATWSEETTGPTLSLGGKRFSRPESFALAAAEAQNWETARDLTLRGALATWLEERGVDPKVTAQVRRLASDENLSEDFRHALALMAMNPSLPLTIEGEIVTPAWLLSHPEEGYTLVTGEVSRHLERMEREPWLVRMRTRAEAVRERARMLEIELDEDRLRVSLLTSSRTNLELERATRRRIYPDTDHAGLASTMERARLSDEELIILVSAATHQLISLAPLLEKAEQLAREVGVVLDRTQAGNWLIGPRRDLFAEVEGRTSNFARCGLERVDEWADAFRVERRMPLERAIVLLAVARDAWKEPPKQQYVANLLEHFEKRVSGAVQRGPLARFNIGKTTARVDLSELGTAQRPAQALLEHVLSRTEMPVHLDPAAFTADERIEGRLRRLASHAQTFRRDTGIDGRYLAFPFLQLRNTRSTSPNAKPRLAPVLLWPAVLDVQSGAHTSTLMFDREREEIRLNPALEGLLGSQQFAKWNEARKELLTRSAIRVGDVMDAFGALASPRGRSLGRLPSKDTKTSSGAPELVCAAALFNAEFTGQALSEDLRQMRRMPPTATGLEAALRVAVDPPVAPPLPAVPERDRYLTVESDPSQEAAVLRARMTPGLLVEGPPGTGKSQTIVNIVADSIGRGETVLVVCQKQAALQVVKKRLESEGLGERLFIVIDVNRDRETIIRALREQLDKVRGANSGPVVALKRNREELAARIESLEAELDRNHEALHAVDDTTGLSYRELLGQLIAVEGSKAPIEVPGLRARFAMLDRGLLSRLEETCAPLARLWLDSGFEGSPLSVLREGVVREVLQEDLPAFKEAEDARCELLKTSQPSFEVDDPAPCRAWLVAHGDTFEAMPEATRKNLAAWFDQFKPGQDGKAPGAQLVHTLEETAQALGRLDENLHDDRLFDTVAALAPGDLKVWLDTTTSATAQVSFFGLLNPERWLRRRRVRTFLTGHGEETTDERMAALRNALELELQLRPLRRSMKETRESLGLPGPDAPASLKVLRREVDGLLAMTRPVQSAAAAALACPRPREAEEMVRSGSLDGHLLLRRKFDSAFARHAARERSRTALARLSQWFQEEWISSCRSNIDKNAPTTAMLQSIIAALGTLDSYQRFRARARGLDPEALALFAALRKREEALKAMPSAHLEHEVRRIIRREALLAWKARREQARPELLLEREEIENKVRSLAERGRDMRALNRRLLANDLDSKRLGTQSAWEDITRLRGPRMKRLREILDLGADLGLMHLRPIWLMTPDVASRVLPLKARLFDLVIYDEASQMPVEHAVPTLFRGSRIVVSGDEKQMPPTNFFTSHIDGDEDEEFDGEGLDDSATEAERTAYEETWNRREVKDCPDLLQLGRGVLLPTTLQIHYRSKYRELINYSNAAFYNGSLSIPARHPEAEIQRVRPIEVVRVDGEYENQTNVKEAERIVDLLAGFWSAPPEQCPSVGVVTFNRKQADLIDEAMENRALADPEFLKAYQRERDRVQGGEDMGFFVKNVENVQGDERDVIIFSTTFGKDRHGSFRRNFGVLGQAGGERRLNVAITRAREKVILVTSIPIRDVSDMLASGRAPNKPRDYLQAYLDYASKISSGQLEVARTSTERLSSGLGARRGEEIRADGFVESVAAYIRELGFEPARTNEGDAFGLDFAIADPRTGLFGIGIECDAPRHKLLGRAREREIWRPAVLSRAIPKVHRVASHGWYHRVEEERRRLRDALHAALGKEEA